MLMTPNQDMLEDENNVKEKQNWIRRYSQKQSDEHRNNSPF